MNFLNPKSIGEQALSINLPIAAAEGKPRVILMLQGHPSPYWGEFHDHMVAEGIRVLKVHFCTADRIFWGRRPGLNYRGRLADWAAWLKALCLRENVTDILYFADRLPYHAAAQPVGQALGIRCWAIEFGYLRPDWLTMERDGMGARSHFPRTAAEIATLAEGWEMPDLKAVYTHGFATEAFLEVSFNLLMVYGRPAYPFYRSDKRYWPALEYLSWLPLLLQERGFDRHAAEVARLAKDGLDYNLIAMQMQGDYQIRDSSPYTDLAEFLREALTSFARHAPPERHVVIKLHPLESGLPQWGRRIRRILRDLGLEARVHVMRGGDLHHMLRHSKGAVMVNSTVGIHALRLSVPVCALGAAVYRVPGLTHERPLDQFWTDPAPVDPALFAQFCRALQSIQVKGSFFNPAGRKVAIAEMARRLLA